MILPNCWVLEVVDILVFSRFNLISLEGETEYSQASVYISSVILADQQCSKYFRLNVTEYRRIPLLLSVKSVKIK